MPVDIAQGKSRFSPLDPTCEMIENPLFSLISIVRVTLIKPFDSNKNSSGRMTKSKLTTFEGFLI